MPRSIPITIGDQQYTLMRSWRTGIAIEKRFKTVDLGVLFQREDQRLQNLLGVLSCLLRDEHGNALQIDEDTLADQLDIRDVPVIIEKLGEVMGDGKPNDPRWLAPFVPTPVDLIRTMLDAANLRPNEVLLDPCCGDGRVLVEACDRSARAIGYELDEERCVKSRAAVVVAGMPAEVHQRDGNEADFSVADVVFLYTLPESNRRLQPALLAQCKDTCRIVSHAFDMPGWRPSQSGMHDGRRWFMWVIGDVRAQIADAA